MTTEERVLVMRGSGILGRNWYVSVGQKCLMSTETEAEAHAKAEWIRAAIAEAVAAERIKKLEAFFADIDERLKAVEKWIDYEQQCREDDE